VRSVSGARDTAAGGLGSRARRCRGRGNTQSARCSKRSSPGPALRGSRSINGWCRLAGTACFRLPYACPGTSAWSGS